MKLSGDFLRSEAVTGNVTADQGLQDTVCSCIRCVTTGGSGRAACSVACICKAQFLHDQDSKFNFFSLKFLSLCVCLWITILFSNFRENYTKS